MTVLEKSAPAGISGLRWWIAGLIFLATLINFVNRLTISVLAPVITEQLKLTNLEFASITNSFLIAYTFSQAISGKLYDRVGNRRGFSISIVVWSLASMLHAFATGLFSLNCFRFLLGFGEAGNWPGAAKVIAEWFPIRQRALGMAIFNSGTSIGSVVAPPIIIALSCASAGRPRSSPWACWVSCGWCCGWCSITRPASIRASRRKSSR